jgi:hypothetical protein
VSAIFWNNQIIFLLKYPWNRPTVSWTESTMAGPWTTGQGTILDRRPSDGRHGFKHLKGYPPHLIVIVDLECDGWDFIKGDPIWSTGFMMGDRKLKLWTGTLLLILTVSGMTSGFGAPAGGEGGARAQHNGGPLKLVGDGWKRGVGAKLTEESLLWRRHDTGNSPVVFTGWWADRKVACDGRVSVPGSRHGESLV